MKFNDVKRFSAYVRPIWHSKYITLHENSNLFYLRYKISAVQKTGYFWKLRSAWLCASVLCFVLCEEKGLLNYCIIAQKNDLFQCFLRYKRDKSFTFVLKYLAGCDCNMKISKGNKMFWGLPEYNLALFCQKVILIFKNETHNSVAIYILLIHLDNKIW